MNFENLQEDAALEGEAVPGPVQTGRGAVQGHGPAGTTRKQTTVAFKFGGSSLLGAERMRQAAELVRAAAEEASVVVVVSAMKGVTDRLLGLAHAFAQRKTVQASREAQAIVNLHFEVMDALGLDGELRDRVKHDLVLLGRDLLQENALEERSDAELFDRLASFGERFSSRLFAAALEQAGMRAVPVCSSDFVLTCETFREAQPDLERTCAAGRELLMPLFRHGVVPVVTGFIGATLDGRITTLGRNSSDFSGALIAHVVHADELVIWTDVDGVYTADPNGSGEAQLLEELSYEEAHALALSGARVVHAKVLPLAAKNQMVVRVRNTFRPEAPGTRIAARKSRGVQ